MNTLNVYALMQHPLRSTASDHLYSFRRHGQGNQFYLNILVRDVPGWVRDAPIDAVVYHTTFFSQRWAPGYFEAAIEKAEPLKGVGRARVALPQDEFLNSRLLARFVNEFEVDHVFTLANESERRKIYTGVDFDRVSFTQALPGYISDHTAKRIEQIVARSGERPIDIGYRAWRGAPWLGRHGLLKYDVGVKTAEAAPRHGLVTDISSSDADVLHGDDWFRFLVSCKYTLGVEGGASMLDPDGEIKQRVMAFTEQHPGADFDEVEAACFPGRDGDLDYFAIGPRHIEACATRTCQVLVEGDYQGVLRPGEHYIALARDLSNLDEVLDVLKRDELRGPIVEAAHRDVIASGRFTYRSLVEGVEAVVPDTPAAGGGQAVAMAIRARTERVADSISWARVIYRVRIHPRWAPKRAAIRGRISRISPYLPHRLLPNAWRRLVRTVRGPGAS